MDVDPETARLEFEKLPPPDQDVFGTLAKGDPSLGLQVPEGLAPFLEHFSGRIRFAEEGFLRIAAEGDPDQLTATHLRKRLQLSFTMVGMRNAQAFCDLPGSPIEAARTLLRFLPDPLCDHLLTACQLILTTRRLEEATARIAELELDLKAVRQDPPEVEL